MAKWDDRSYEQYLRDLPGEAGEVMRAALGQTQLELEKAFEYEARPRRGVFNRKLNRKR